MRLRDYMGKPVILSLVYFDCPMLCGLILTGAARGMRKRPASRSARTSTPSRSASTRANHAQGGRAPARLPPGAGQAGGEGVVDLPDRRGGRRPRGGRRGGLQVHVRRADAPVRAPGGALRAHARRARLALPLRHRVPRARRAARAGRGERGEGGHQLRPPPAHLLSLRSASRKYEPYVLGFVRVSMSMVLVGLVVMLGILWRRDLKRSRAKPGPGAPGGGSVGPAGQDDHPRATGSGQR